MKTIKKLIVFLMSLAMVMSLMTGIVFADEEETTDVVQEQTEYVEMEGEATSEVPDFIPENDELLTDYIEIQLSTSNKAAYSVMGARNRLSGVDAIAYDLLKEQIALVANGSRERTEFQFTAEDFSLPSSWTAEDLGVESLGTVEGSNLVLTEEARSAINDQFANLNLVITALLFDCPYELYWYNKSVDNACSFSWRMTGSYNPTTSKISTVSITNITYAFKVADEYASAEDYVVDTNTIDSINTAISNAQAIVAAHAEEGDYEKLNSYREEICEATAYNYAAAEDDTTPYGNPWQMIWVFDEDMETNVVCEGYAKAFQYLCDMSDFNSSYVESNLVTGNMVGGTGAGGHMWNVVTMDDDQNYLVDVTNCDAGTIGASDQLFLVGSDGDYDENTGYTFWLDGQDSISYIYDEDTMGVYTEAGDYSTLILANSNYSPEADQTISFDIQGGLLYNDEMKEVTLDLRSVQGMGYVFQVQDVGFWNYGTSGEYVFLPLTSMEEDPDNYDYSWTDITDDQDNVIARTYLLNGANIYEKWQDYNEDDNINADNLLYLYINLTTRDGSMLAYTQTDLFVRKSQIYYPYFADSTDLLWGDAWGLQKDSEMIVDNAYHPYGENISVYLSNMISSDPSVIRVVDAGPNWRLDAAGYGTAQVTASIFDEQGNELEPYTFTVNVVDSIYYIQLETDNGSQMALPGTTKVIAATVNHRFRERDNGNAYGDEDATNQVMYEWSIEDYDFATIDDSSANPVIVNIKEKQYLSSPYYSGGTIRVKIYAEQGAEQVQVCEQSLYLQVSDDYLELYPLKLPRQMATGQSTDVTATLLEITEEYPEGTPIEDVTFQWEYNPEQVSITPKEEGTYTGSAVDFTITRLSNRDGSNIRLIAEWQNAYGYTETRTNSFWLDPIYIWFNSVPYYFYTDGLMSLDLNLDTLKKFKPDDYSVYYTVGIWDETAGDDGSGEWTWVFENSEDSIYYTVENNQITLNGTQFTEYEGQSIRILAEVKTGTNHEYVLCESECFVNVRASVIYLDKCDDFTTVPGVKNAFADVMHVYYFNSQGSTAEVYPVTMEVVSDPNQVLTLTHSGDSWQYRISEDAIAPSDVVIGVSYRDRDNLDQYYEFTIHVIEELYSVRGPNYMSASVLPGTEHELFAEVQYQNRQGSIIISRSKVEVDGNEELESFAEELKNNIQYEWSLDANYEGLGIITPITDDPSRALLTAYNKIESFVQIRGTIRIKDLDGNELAQGSWLTFVDPDYTEIVSTELDEDLNIGQTAIVSAEYRHYKVDYIGQDPDGYILENAQFRWYYDESQVAIFDEEGNLVGNNFDEQGKAYTLEDFDWDINQLDAAGVYRDSAASYGTNPTFTIKRKSKDEIYIELIVKIGADWSSFVYWFNDVTEGDEPGSLITITKQPEDMILVPGESTEISIEAEGEGLTYQWYYRLAGKTNFTLWKNKTASSFSYRPTEDKAGMEVRCVIKDSAGNEATSESATLTFIANPITITKQPEDMILVPGESTEISIEAEGEGLTYQWYYRLAGKTNFTLWKNKTASSFSYKPTEDKAGMEVRCVIKDSAGNEATSESATLTFIANPITITKQPEDMNLVPGESTEIRIEAEGEGLTYQWYYRLAGKTNFTLWKNKTASSFSYKPTEDKAGMEVRCVIRDSAGNEATSESATLTFIASPITITKQPEDVSIVSGENAAFSVEAEGEGLTYQWYYRLAGKTNFTLWKNKTASSFSYKPTEDKAGMEVRCVIKDSAGNEATSESATLTFLANPITITKQPEDVSIVSGENAAFSVEAEGEGLTYQWYYRLAGKTNFTLWKGKTEAEFSYVPKADKDGMEVRCVITDAAGNTLTSDTVVMTFVQ